jgi:hypothetical protein
MGLTDFIRHLRHERAHPPSYMDVLPSEIISRIISFACTDPSGKTTRALSLVSKYISTLTESHKYDFVSISGKTQLKAFLKVLQQKPARTRGLVRSLFITDIAQNPKSKHFRFTVDFFRTRSTKKSRDGKSFLRHLQTLLSLIAPSLTTLTCITIQQPVTQDIFEFSYPALKRLSLRVSRIPDPPPLNKIHMPSLKYLHFSSAFYFDWMELDAIATIATQCEALDTLMLSGPLPQLKHFKELYDAEFVHPEMPAQSVTPLLQGTIRHVVLQPFPIWHTLDNMKRNDTPRKMVEIDPEPGLIFLAQSDVLSCNEWRECASDEQFMEGGLRAIAGAEVEKVFADAAISFSHLNAPLYVYFWDYW